MPLAFVKKTWKNRTDPTLVKGVDPDMEADEFNRIEQGIADTVTEVLSHEFASTDVHGIADTSALETQVGAQAKADAAQAASDPLGSASAAQTAAESASDPLGSAATAQTNAEAASVPRAIVTTKGDLLVGTSAAAIARLAAGADGDLLVADAAQSDGLKWATPASAIGGSIASTVFRIVTPDGANVFAYDKTGTAIYTGLDAAAALTACLPAANSEGATIAFRNDGFAFPWASVPGVAPGITNKLLIQGNGSRITLSAAGPRFLDLVRTADYQTFQHIEATDFVIDATSRPDTATHTILGAPTSQRINFLDITLRRIRCFGVGTTHSSGVYLLCTQLAGGEATANTIKDILLEDVWIDGGISGFVVAGSTAPFDVTVTNLNVSYDNIRLIRCKQTQSAGAVVGASGTAANIEIGQNASGGYVLIRDFYGEYSADVGIEVDNAARADHEDCLISNAPHAYYTTNFALSSQPNAQSYSYRRCKSSVTDPAVAAGAHAFSLALNNAVALGEYHYDRCVMFQNNNVLSTGGNSPTMFYMTGAFTARQVTIDSCSMNVESINWNNAGNCEPIRGINLSAGCAIKRVVVRDFYVRVAGQISGAGLVQFRAIGNESTAFTGCLQVDGLTIDYNVTGIGAGGVTFGVLLGGAGSSVSGSIKRMRIISLGTDTAAKGVQIGATANITITSAPFLFADNDWTAIPTGGNEISINATQTALGAVLTVGNRWKTKPAPVGLTGLVTGVGKALGAQAASIVWQCIAVIAQGSGVAITAIDFSTNGGTTYTNKLTQASAPIPGGFDQDIAGLTPGDLIKATFTTTQPTITLVPINP